MLNRLSKYKAKLFTFANTKLGCSFTKNTSDRVWLENWIFDNCYGCRVLSVGLKWYDICLSNITLSIFWNTVDIAAEAVQFACFSDRHYTVDLTKPGVLLNPAVTYDVIILNNVLGRGVNTKAEAKVMLSNLESMLKVGGKLLIGYNASARRGVSYYPEQCVSSKLTQIDKTVANANRRSMYTFTTFTKI